MTRRRLKQLGVIAVIAWLGIAALRPKLQSHDDQFGSGHWLETSAGMIGALNDKSRGSRYLALWIGSNRHTPQAIGWDRRDGLIFQVVNPWNGKLLFCL